MTEFEAINSIHIELRDACSRHPLDFELEQLRQKVWARVKDAQRRFTPPLVFDTGMYGYVTLGLKGHAQAYPHPGHRGLDDASVIFWHGSTVSSTLNACDLVGTAAKRPGNTLRNRLAKAAHWVEYGPGRCLELARAIRSISISDDGHIAVGQRQVIELVSF